MRLNLKTLTLMAVLGLAAYAAYAENVQISTYYPSPYGSYQTLDVTGATTLANAGAAVALGTSTAPPAGVKLDVQGGYVRTQDTPAGGTTFAYMQRDATSSKFGSIDGAAAVFGNSEGTLTMDGGKLGVGVANPAAGTYKLDVAGTANVQGQISVRDSNGSSGVLQVDCTTVAGKCYPVYA